VVQALGAHTLHHHHCAAAAAAAATSPPPHIASDSSSHAVLGEFPLSTRCAGIGAAGNRSQPQRWAMAWSGGSWQEEAGMATHRRHLRRCRLLGARFTDTSFPPHMQCSVVRPEERERLQGSDELLANLAPQWRRLYDLALIAAGGDRDDDDDGAQSRGASAPVLFERHVDASDAVQGALGDCWLISALSIVTQQPLLLHSLFAAADLRSGLYTLRLFHDGAWRLVTIDDYVPVSVIDGETPLFAHSRSRRELWVPLLEKAFAKLYGSCAHRHHQRAACCCPVPLLLSHTPPHHHHHTPPHTTTPPPPLQFSIRVINNGRSESAVTLYRGLIVCG
jgi:hypothetical protein